MPEKSRRRLRNTIRKLLGIPLPAASRIPSDGKNAPGVPNTRQVLGGVAASVGRHTYGNPTVFTHAGGVLTIGDYCSIAAEVNIWLGGNHRLDWVTSYPFRVFQPYWSGASGVEGPDPASRGPVSIGNDVWIGHSATILSGVTIGDGAVIGAHCVVAKDVPPYAIVVGNPQRQVGSRFDAETIERLLKLAWWTLPEERINELLPLMLSSDVQTFLAAADRAGHQSGG